jgi:hypothetical protein
VLPIVHRLEKEYDDRILFVRVNILIPENKPLLEQYGFSATPEFYLVDEQGGIIGFWEDAVEEDQLRQAFDEALN